MKTRTLSQICFFLMIIILTALYSIGLPRWTMLVAWLISGILAFNFGLSHKSKQQGWDLIEVGMAFVATLLGLVSLFVTSFTDGEEHDDSARSDTGR